jgi:hypothetical protein
MIILVIIILLLLVLLVPSDNQNNELQGPKKIVEFTGYEMDEINEMNGMNGGYEMNEMEFPYMKKFLPDPEIMFNNLKEPIDINKRHNSIILIRRFPEDYYAADALSNHYIEDVRIDCRAGQYPTPREVWESGEIELVHENDKDEIKSVRDKIYMKTRECNTFNPNIVRMVVEWMESNGHKNIKILDPSAGWGDRMIGAAISNVETYHGFDPNPRLVPCHTKIIEDLVNENWNYQVIESPFMADKIPLNKYDLVITSPPYFAYEEYVEPGKEGESFQSIGKYPKYKQWIDKMYKPYLTDAYNALKSGGVMIIYIENIVLKGKYYPLADLTKNIIADLGGIGNKIPNFGLKVKMQGVKAKIRWALSWTKQ